MRGSERVDLSNIGVLLVSVPGKRSYGRVANMGRFFRGLAVVVALFMTGAAYAQITPGKVAAVEEQKDGLLLRMQTGKDEGGGP